MRITTFFSTLLLATGFLITPVSALARHDDGSVTETRGTITRSVPGNRGDSTVTLPTVIERERSDSDGTTVVVEGNGSVVTITSGATDGSTAEIDVTVDGSSVTQEDVGEDQGSGDTTDTPSEDTHTTDRTDRTDRSTTHEEAHASPDRGH